MTVTVNLATKDRDFRLADLVSRKFSDAKMHRIVFTIMRGKSYQKCAKEGCNCMAEPGSKYCSMQCQDSKKFMTLKCACGHPACAA